MSHLACMIPVKVKEDNTNVSSHTVNVFFSQSNITVFLTFLCFSLVISQFKMVPQYRVKVLSIILMCKKAMTCFIECYGLDLECLPKVHVFKALSQMQPCSEAGHLGGDWLVRALTLSMY